MIPLAMLPKEDRPVLWRDIPKPVDDAVEGVVDVRFVTGRGSKLAELAVVPTVIHAGASSRES